MVFPFVQLCYFFLMPGLVSCGNGRSQNMHEIRIQWVDNLPGDFSFKDDWSYPEGVYRNEFGQLSCDGFCPPETDAMFDGERRILADSLEPFYNLVDTTHLYHSISSEAWTYEWTGTDFIIIKRIHRDTILCYTMNNAATHSRLHLEITGNTVIPTIELNSITSIGLKIFSCTGGTMTIDRSFWEKGLLKAVFNFDFEDKERPDEPMNWKGKIYAEIED